MQQATNDVSQMGTEELVEDDLRGCGLLGSWSEVVAGTSRAISIPVLSIDTRGGAEFSLSLKWI